MNHSEAVEQMTSERYLLNELAPDARDAFEEHVFDCPECALNLRAGALFVHEAKDSTAATCGFQAGNRDVKIKRKEEFLVFIVASRICCSCLCNLAHRGWVPKLRHAPCIAPVSE